MRSLIRDPYAICPAANSFSRGSLVMREVYRESPGITSSGAPVEERALVWSVEIDLYTNEVEESTALSKTYLE